MLCAESAHALRAPTNGYPHSGAPKRFVHLVGPPLGMALDARGAGEKGRRVRSGCWPNVEVRAYVCKGASAGNANVAGGSGNGDVNGNGKGKGNMREDDRADDAEAGTHIFATRALKQWDGHGTMRTRWARLPLGIAPTPTHRSLISQLTNILHALGGTSVGRACAPSTAIATPTPPAHVPLTPREKERRVTPGIESRPTVVSADKEEVDGGDGAGARARVRYTHGGTGDIPAVPFERVQPRYHIRPGAEMDVDIDIEGEDAPAYTRPPRRLSTRR